jgi:hypothetical protein
MVECYAFATVKPPQRNSKNLLRVGVQVNAEFAPHPTVAKNVSGEMNFAFLQPDIPSRVFLARLNALVARADLASK